MRTYSKFVPFQTDPEALLATEQHVRAHLSSVAAPDDDEDRYASEVQIRLTSSESGVLVQGTLDREPDAPYLREGFDPEQDVADNPLSVPSILEGQ
jgi:hypothetical protein